MMDQTLFFLALYNSKGSNRQFLSRLVLEHKAKLSMDHVDWEVSQAHWDEAQRQRTALECMGIQFVPGYQLAQWHSPSAAIPPMLFWRGSKSAIRKSGVAIVGARRAQRSLEWVESLAQFCALNDIPVISGGALGVDSAAHEGALEGRGMTTAYLGVAVDRLYPSQNRGLFGRIIENGGAIASEHPPGAITPKYEHAHRNRLITMQAQAVVVAEAGPKSGTLGTVRWAARLGLPVWCPPESLGGERAGIEPLLSSGKVRTLNDLNRLISC